MNTIIFSDYKVHTYTLQPVEPPLIVGLDHLERRHGAIVEVMVKTATDSFSVFSDLAPLQGFSQDALYTSLQAIERTFPRWLDQELPLIDVSAGLSDLWEAFVDVESDLNALSWCFFGICVQTHAAAKNISVHEVLSKAPIAFKPELISLNGKGPGILKLKFHKYEDLAEIQKIAQLQRVHLDSNRAFDGIEVMLLASELPMQNIVVWEEPTHDQSAFQSLREVGFHTARDESLLAAHWINFPCDTYVIKPTVLGWRKTMDVIAHARKKNRPIVISSAYESQIGRDFLEAFGGALGPKTKLGLGSENLYRNNISLEDFR